MPDLLACIRFRDKDRPEGAAKVADFILQENELTAKSLPKLTEVVALSAGDLRELDVSDNKIQIETSEDKAAWLAFLQAFAGCYMLKKLNLGGNKIGTAGMEILARVYTKSDLDFVEGDAHDVLGSKTDDESGLAENMEAMDIKSGKENEPAKSRSKKTFGKSKTSKSNGECFPALCVHANGSVPLHSHPVVDQGYPG